MSLIVINTPSKNDTDQGPFSTQAYYEQSLMLFTNIDLFATWGSHRQSLN